jgi:hypothetical protein
MTPTPEIHAAAARNVVTFSPFTAPDGTPDTNVAFIFESFEVNGPEDLFDGHKREELENAARILFHSGERFNFSKVLAATL